MKRPCLNCQGAGYVSESSTETLSTCPVCEGTGARDVPDAPKPTPTQGAADPSSRGRPMPAHCPHCRGAGVRVTYVTVSNGARLRVVEAPALCTCVSERFARLERRLERLERRTDGTNFGGRLP